MWISFSLVREVPIIAMSDPDAGVTFCSFAKASAAATLGDALPGSASPGRGGGAPGVACGPAVTLRRLGWGCSLQALVVLALPRPPLLACRQGGRSPPSAGSSDCTEQSRYAPRLFSPSLRSLTCCRCFFSPFSSTRQATVYVTPPPPFPIIAGHSRVSD